MTRLPPGCRPAAMEDRERTDNLASRISSMPLHSQVSDECVDQLVELLFVAVPAMSGPELGVLLNLLLRIVEAEARRAASEERATLMARMRAPSLQ